LLEQLAVVQVFSELLLLLVCMVFLLSPQEGRGVVSWEMYQ
jgi:hypothetical protein